MKCYLYTYYSVVLAACSNDEDHDDNQHSEKHAPKNVKVLTEKDIFHSNKSGENISEEEMNNAIKKYLEVNSVILDNKYLMQYKLDRQSNSDKKITDKQSNAFQTYHVTQSKMMLDLKNSSKTIIFSVSTFTFLGACFSLCWLSS